VVDDLLSTVVRVDYVTGDRTIVARPARIGTGLLLLDPTNIAVEGDDHLVVLDSAVLDASRVARVDPRTGDRTIVSGVDPATGGPIGSGAPFVFLLGGIVITVDGNIVVTDDNSTGEQTDAAVVQVNLATGERSFVSGRGTGSGPRLIQPLGVAVAAGGTLVVVDTILHAMVQVDPRTGNRRIVSR
jgi:hypothetical protein